MKKEKLFFLLFLLGILFIFPFNTSAKEQKDHKKLIVCEYQYQYSQEESKNIAYEINSDKTLNLPFQDQENYIGKKPWYHAVNFTETYLNSSNLGENAYTCPTITIEKNNNFYTIFNNDKTTCNGECTKLEATRIRSYSNHIKIKKIIDSTTGSSIGLYQKSSYVFPYFRLLEDNTKEWSLDGRDYVSIEKQIMIGKKDIFVLSDDFIDSIFQEKKVIRPEQIYRCVTNKKGTNFYQLSIDKKECPKNDLSTKDNQAMSAIYATNDFGERVTEDDLSEWVNGYTGTVECTGGDDSNSLLGNPENPNSVAWLVQKILNYLKILGPILVVVLSGVDFAKAALLGDADTMKKAQTKLFTRIGLAIALFLIPMIVSALLNIFGITSDPICGLR